MDVKKVSFILLGLLALIVFLQNTQVVAIRFLFWQISMSSIILLPLVMAAGMAIGFVLGKRL